MKNCLKQFIVMYFVCISLVLCASISCDGRSVIPSRQQPSWGSNEYSGYPREAHWLNAKPHAQPTSIYQSLFPTDSTLQQQSYQYPSVQPNYYQVQSVPSYSTPFEYQPQSRVPDTWSSWNQYQSPLSNGGSSGLSLSDLLGGGVGGGSSSNLRLPSSYSQRQPEIVITEYPSRYDKYEKLYPSYESDLYKPLYSSGYNQASASAAAQGSSSSLPSLSNSGGWSSLGAIDSYEKPYFSYRRNLGNEGESVNGGSKALTGSSDKGVSNESNDNAENTRRYLGSGESKQEAASSDAAVSVVDNQSAASGEASVANGSRRSLGNKNAAKPEEKSGAAAQLDETSQKDKLQIETRLDLSSIDEDTTQNDKVNDKTQ